MCCRSLASSSLPISTALSRASRVDEVTGIIVGCTIGTLLGVAVDSLALRDFVVGRDYSRMMVFYAWLLSILLVALGRLLNDAMRRHTIRAGWGAGACFWLALVILLG